MIAEDGVVVDLVDGKAHDRRQGRRAATSTSTARRSATSPSPSLKDRRILGEEGFISVIVVVDSATGKVAGGPEIHARGFAEDDAAFDERQARRSRRRSTRSAPDGVDDTHQLQQLDPPRRRAVGHRHLPPPPDDHPGRRRGLTARRPDGSSGAGRPICIEAPRSSTFTAPPEREPGALACRDQSRAGGNSDSEFLIESESPERETREAETWKAPRKSDRETV